MGIPLTEKARSLLLSNKERLSRDFMAEHVVSYLVQMSVITPVDMSDILDEKTQRLKAAALLDMVLKKGQGAYNALYMAFKEQYSWLATILHDGVTRDGYDSDDDQGYATSEIQSILRKGGIPVRPRVYVDRPQEIQKMRNALSKLKDTPGFVVVHGMGGVGKSVLAAEALRDSTVLKDYFPGGVIWTSVGKVDKEQLLVKVQNLCVRLDQNQSRSPPRNLEEARDRLRSILHEQYPCCLVIFDDVWSPKVLQGIDVQARVLVTTRDKSVTDSISGRVYEVPLGDGGFSEAQALYFLASWARSDVEALPPAAKAIAQESKGSPLILSIIGGLLNDNPHRWDFYAQKLKARNYSRLRKRSTYEYKSVDEAIGTSVDELSEPLREMYQDFAVFNPGMKIPGKVLSIYWNKPVEDVEEDILPLVNKSLIRQEWVDELDCMVYTLHDLLMDFLKHLCPDEKALHRKLARRYAELCGNKFETLEPDDYAHWYLAVNAAEGEVYDVLQPLLCNWHWIVQKIKVAGPSSLLNDLINYSHLLQDGDRKMAQQIKSFISVNAHLLIQRPHPDMIQLALNNEENSPLYQMALNLMKMSPDGLYLKWVNRDSQPVSLLLASQVHTGVAYCAQFSPDCNSIVSCGEDQTVHITMSSSAQVEKVFKGHTDEVTWCSFSPEGDMVMSCSSNGEVIIWETLTGEEIKSIPTGGTEMITMCQFSHDGRFFGFCSLLGAVCVGDTDTYEITTHPVCNAGISSMAFSPDASKIIASAYDVTVRIIVRHSGQELENYANHKYHVVWCDFFPSGDKVASADAGEVHIWDPLSGKRLDKIPMKGAYILRCAISHQGNLLAGVLSDCTVWLWECENYTAMAVHHGHSSWINSVAFDCEDERLVTAATDGTVMVWKAVTSSPANTAMLLRKFAVHFNQDSTVEFVCASDRNHQCLVLRGGEGKVISTEKSKITCLSLAEDGERAAYGCDDGSVVIFLPRSEKILEKMHEHKQRVLRCQVSHDGKKVASCSGDQTVVVWTEGSGKCTLKGHLDTVNFCHFMQSDSALLTGAQDGFIQVWDINSAKSKKSVKAHSDWILSCDVSSDESLVVTTSVDKTVKIWSVSDLKLVRTLTDHQDLVRSCRFSYDGSLLATGDDSGIINIWDVSTGARLGNCWRHYSWVTYLHFSKDNKMLVSVGENVRWWGIDGSRVQSFVIRGSYLRQIETDSSFSTFVSIDSAGTLYILSRLKASDVPDLPEVIYV